MSTDHREEHISRLPTRRAVLRAGGAALTTAALAICAGRAHSLPAQQPSPAAASPVAMSGNFSGLVDIGGRKIFLECQGSGKPTVALEAGYRSPATVWTDDLIEPGSHRTMVFPAWRPSPASAPMSARGPT